MFFRRGPRLLGGLCSEVFKGPGLIEPGPWSRGRRTCRPGLADQPWVPDVAHEVDRQLIEIREAPPPGGWSGPRWR